MSEPGVPSSGLYELSLILPRNGAFAVADLLEGLGESTEDQPPPPRTAPAPTFVPAHDAPLSVTFFEVPGGVDFRVSALFSEPPLTETIARFIAPLIDSLALSQPALAVTAIDDRDWVSESLKELPAITAGRFHIAGTHTLAEARPCAIRLQIDAGQAFGTGHHETTTGCLLALDQLARQRAFSSILDLGCGTGILAMAAAKLWHRRVLASDIDPVAIQVTRQNAQLNGLAALTSPIVATGFRATALTRNAPYDLIIANILARPLMSLAYPLSRHLARDGIAVLSGLLTSQVPAILAAYRMQGIFLQRRIYLGDWCTLILGR